MKYTGNAAPSVTAAQLCDPAPVTTEAVTTAVGGTTAAPTNAPPTTPVPDHCQDILSNVEIKDNWQCRACSRARFYAQSIPTFTPDDTLTVTFGAEVEFRNINYPIKEIKNVSGFKYEISFEPGTQAQLCDPAPVTTEAVTTAVGDTTAAPTMAPPTTPVPDHCQDILSLVEIKDNWQ